MNSRLFVLLAALAASVTVTAALAAEKPAVPTARLDIAQLDPDGKLRKPADLTDWIFLGVSLGMGYNPGSFNAAHPGQFQVVLMEPAAYRYFAEHRTYAPGSMLMLAFYDADTQVRSINQHGFTQADLTNYEIHVIGAAPGPDGHAFYTFGANDTLGNAVPPDNACVRCHVQHGAFNGTFAQFYPTIRPLIPKENLERAAQDHDIR